MTDVIYDRLIFSLRRALWLFIFGVLLILGMCCYCGLLIYATYHDCDPLTTKVSLKSNLHYNSQYVCVANNAVIMIQPLFI